LESQISEAGKVVVMQKIDIIVASSTFERLPQQSYAMALFVFWYGLGLVGALVSWKRLPACRNK
jgi:hypothetical protein